MRYSIRYNMCVIFRCVLYYTFLWKGFAPFTAFVVSSSKGSKLCMSQRSLSIDEKEVQRELDSLDLILEKLQVQNEVPLHCKLDLAPVACDANSNTCHTVTKYWCRKLFSPKRCPLYGKYLSNTCGDSFKPLVMWTLGNVAPLEAKLSIFILKQCWSV